MAKRLVFSVDNITLVLLRTNPAQLHITAHGMASSTGWTEPSLELIDPKSEPSPDGVLDFNFVAKPPGSVSLPVITPISAYTVWTQDADKLVAVRMVSRTNEKTELVRPAYTTFALGEEMQPIPFPRPWPWPKMAIPEHPRPTFIREAPPTVFLGEHWPPVPPSDPRGEDPRRPFDFDDPLDPMYGRGPFGGGGL